jgi:hypothetical protein
MKTVLTPLSPSSSTKLLKLTTLVVVCLSTQANAIAQITNDLTPTELVKIEGGKEVLKTKEVGKTWPQVIIYRKVNASPEAITKLFLDYEKAHTYIPSLKSATIEKNIDQNTKDVRYTVGLPIVLTLSYLIRNQYEKTDTGHKISWNLIESSLVKSATGNLRIEPYNTGSVICYQTHIEPATSLVSRLKGHAIKEASSTVKAIANKAESLPK